VPSISIRAQLLDGCQRLAAKDFLNSPADSFSLRMPGQMKMMLISGIRHWHSMGVNEIRPMPFSATDPLSMLHAAVYEERGDVGAIAITSPKWVGLLAALGGQLPPIFDEQVRHIGLSVDPLTEVETLRVDLLRKALRRGNNAVVLGSRLLCLGMTRDRVLFNTELYEKCAQAYVLAKTCNTGIRSIPGWVRLIANRRLMKDEKVAADSYREGRIPEDIQGY
jgi:hypothetical protein